MRKRKVVKSENDYYMLVKPTEPGSWNRIGKTYHKRGLMNYIINEARNTLFDIDDLSFEDRVEIGGYIKKGEGL